MPNVSRPFGYRPVKHTNGSAFNGQVNLYHIPASDATVHAVGDLVDLAGTADANGVRQVTRAVAAGPAIGAIVGFQVDPTNLQNSGFRPASTSRYVLVADSPDPVFEAQCPGSFGVTTDPGLNANTTVTAATANAGAGQSNMQVDLTTKAVTAGLLVKILDVIQRPDVDLADPTNMKVHVTINNHRYSGGVAGV